MENNVIELLRNDSEYYSGEGRKYLSNSDIGTLLSNPKNFGTPRDDSKELIQGRLFHQMLIEPDKVDLTHVVDVSTRTTKEYKEYIKNNELSIALLSSEVEEVKSWTSAMKGNIIIYDEIYKQGNVYEEPAIGEIEGFAWKGKADIITNDYIIDLKTTSDISKFARNAYIYNYDSQGYIYQTLFGKPIKYLVVCKATLQVGIFTPTEAFINNGGNKVKRALSIYEKYFGVNKTDDIDNYIIEGTLG
jgi:hypothetical protein